MVHGNWVRGIVVGGEREGLVFTISEDCCLKGWVVGTGKVWGDYGAVHEFGITCVEIIP